MSYTYVFTGRELECIARVERKNGQVKISVQSYNVFWIEMSGLLIG